LSDKLEPLHIVELQVSNIKKIKAVRVEPDGNVVIITGKNEQGKSSLLDAIFVGFCGGEATKRIDDLISSGQDEGEIVIDLGEYVITRTARRKEGKTDVKLKLTTRDGAKVQSPQAIIDGMLDAIAFDPQEFSEMSPAEQRNQLIDLIGKREELDSLDAIYNRTFEERTDVNRSVRDIDGNLKSATDHSVEFGSAAVPEISVNQLTAEREAAFQHNQEIRGQQTSRDGAAEANRQHEESIKKLEQQIELIRRSVEHNNAVLKSSEAELQRLGNLIDVEPLKQKAGDIENLNRKIREHNSTIALTAERADLSAIADQLSHDLQVITDKKLALFDDTKLPIKGLAVTDTGVTYQGKSFNDCAKSVKIRVSVVMIMARRPRIRVMVIHDGSLLDKDAMQTIYELARKYKFQVWIERVEDASKSAVVIEDGEIA
jgi:DNA repair exonuclease SbcCD ATPase subunit